MSDRILLSLGLALAMLVCPPLVEAQEGEREEILSFHSSISVRADASIAVRETITVRSTQSDIRHGVYRDMPTVYGAGWGLRRTVPFRVSLVLRNGRPEPYHMARIENGKRLYIGSENVLVDKGEHTYVIEYTTDRQVGFFTDHDELYWNVTGNGWGLRIRKAVAWVSLPEGVSSEDVDVEAYTGPEGARGSDYSAEVTVDGVAEFATTRTLGPGEGLTVVVSWPKGHVTPPTSTQRLARLLGDNLGLLVGVAGVGLIVAYFFVAWANVGRDPEGGTIIPLFEPPAGLGAGAVRFIWRMGYDKKVYAAALIDMAARGYLTIEDADGTYRLRKTGTPEDVLTEEEAAVAAPLFRSRKSVKLVQSNHGRIRRSISDLKETLKTRYGNRYFHSNLRYLIPGAAASVVVLLAGATLYAPGPAVFLCVWLSFWTLAVVVLLVGAGKAWGAFLHGNRTVSGFLSALGMTLFALPFTFFELLALWMLTRMTGIPLLLLALLLIGVNLTFRSLLKAPTAEGRALMDRIDGFRMYLSVAERHRFDMLAPPDRTPELFERYFPYALALDVDQEWAERFSDVLASSTVEKAAYTPTWYSGTRWSGLGTGMRAGSFGASLGAVAAASATAPGSSSGSGGGGSSGGGGGGGGGGGW